MMAAPFAAHVPVLLDPLLAAVAPVAGAWLDGTFGAGGYARALLDAGAARVIGVDRDPIALARAAAWAAEFPGLTLVEGRFGELDRLAAAAGAPALAGVVLDIGVSSMQLDEAARPHAHVERPVFLERETPRGATAADLVNRLPEAALADIFYRYGEERASRRISRAIVADRAAAPFETTLALAGLVERLLPRPKRGEPHPATRVFQALRIAVNDELGELARGLAAAEVAINPRARSAKLRVARRLDTPALALDPASLGLPPLALEALA